MIAKAKTHRQLLPGRRGDEPGFAGLDCDLFILKEESLTWFVLELEPEIRGGFRGRILTPPSTTPRRSPRTFLVLSLAPASESSSQAEQRDHAGEQPDGEENGKQSELHAGRFQEDAPRLNFNLSNRAAELQRAKTCLILGS